MKNRIIALLTVLILIFVLSACDAGETTNNGKIKMPKSTEEYIDSDWTVDSITEHFKELGFTKFRTVPCDPDDDKYEKNIFEMYIETGMFSTDPWEAGQEFDADSEISIYYNEFPMLTIDNCPDLKTALYTTDLSYTSFASEYDGRYVEFEGYVHSHTTYDGGTSHIIDVAAGNASDKDAPGLIVRIGDRTWGNNINESVEEGDLVIVSGKIDESWCDYYNQFYVECQVLERR